MDVIFTIQALLFDYDFGSFSQSLTAKEKRKLVMDFHFKKIWKMCFELWLSPDIGIIFKQKSFLISVIITTTSIIFRVWNT